MNMKAAALVILGIGLLMTLYTGFRYVTKEKVVDLGAVEITKDNEHSASWSPFIGIGIMIVGGVMLAVSSKKSVT